MNKTIEKELREHEKVTWHAKHKHARSLGERVSDAVASGMGSWRFIIIQSIVVFFWIILNFVAYFGHWDPYPFILLNLIFSTQAAYAAPVIMMAQNRQSERDRHQALEDYETNIKAKIEIEALQKHLTSIEDQKLDKILEILREIKSLKK